MDPRYGKLADVLCGFSTRLKKGENVRIDAPDVPEDFVIARIRAARARGATVFNMSALATSPEEAGAMLQRFGYAPTHTIYTKRLN
jgi:leucyl aminopeptidase (aminopeptidase T)